MRIEEGTKQILFFQPLARARGETAAGADLGGGSKYSNLLTLMLKILYNTCKYNLINHANEY